jgi:diaminopimelate decarboxylase
MPPRVMSTSVGLSHVFPLGSRLNEAGRLEVGGCDVFDVAREYGTPAYVVAEDDVRTRARTYLEAFRSRHEASDVVFGSKAFPAVAVVRIFAEEGLGIDVASGGELALALRAGVDPERLVVHGNAKTEDELRMAYDAGAGLIVVDNQQDIDRLEQIVGVGGRPQRVLIRVTPGIKPSTHSHISTGQLDSKFGFNLDDARRAIARAQESDQLEMAGIHSHIGSQIFELESFQDAIAAIAGMGEFEVWNVGGGLGVAYTAHDEPPPIEAYAEAIVSAAHEHLGTGVRLMVEPGRSLVANSTVTLYRVQTIKRNVSTYVGVDGGMSDNMRPMLYGSRYEAHIADRFGGGSTRCHIAGKHCESSDIVVKDVDLDDPRPGDLIVVPATGAYGHAMASNYNGVARPPVILCRDGQARVVVRRETYEDLAARDVV